MKLIEKIKNSKVGKWVAACSVTAAIAAMSCMSVFAADPEVSEESVDLAGSLTTAFTGVKNDIFGYIVVILPIALAVVGAFFGIKKAISFFKSTAGK